MHFGAGIIATEGDKFRKSEAESVQNILQL